MSKYCPICKEFVVYLDCLDCVQKECKTMKIAEQLTLFDLEEKPTKSVCLSVGEFARLLSSKGYKIGQKRLFGFLRNSKIIDQKNIPYQRFLELKYFKLVKCEYEVKGEKKFSFKTFITPKGQIWIKGLLDNEKAMDRS